MSKDLKLQVTDEPTIWNKEMAIGTFLLPIPIVGSLVGGYIGKGRMKREKEEGRTVTDEPSAWNKDTLLGGLLGGAVGRVIAFAIGAIASAIFPDSEDLIMASSSALGSVGGMLIGGYMGADHGVKRQKHDYEQAKHQQVEKQIGQAMGRAPEREAELGKGKDFAMALEQERSQTTHIHRG